MELLNENWNEKRKPIILQAFQLNYKIQQLYGKCSALQHTYISVPLQIIITAKMAL